MSEARLTAEDLRDQSLAAADAYVKACGVAAEELARTILPLVKRAEDEGLDKNLAAGALVSMFMTFDNGTAIVDAAMNKVAKEMGLVI